MSAFNSKNRRLSDSEILEEADQDLARLKAAARPAGDCAGVIGKLKFLRASLWDSRPSSPAERLEVTILDSAIADLENLKKT